MPCTRLKREVRPLDSANPTRIYLRVASSNHVSWRHHYVPQFYLRGWTDADGMLWCYERRSGRIVRRRVSPRATAFHRDLNITHDLLFPEQASDAIETRFLSPLDNTASLVLGKLVDPHEPPLSDDERRSWARFIVALHHRSPRQLEAEAASARDLGEQVRQEMLDRAPSSESRTRVAEVFALMDEAKAAGRLVRESMVKGVECPKTTDILCGFTWRVFNVNSHVELVTSDRPLVINCGASPPPVNVLTISLSPTRLFVMHTPSFELDGALAEKLARIHLHIACRDACYVYATDRVSEPDVVALIESTNLR